MKSSVNCERISRIFYFAVRSITFLKMLMKIGFLTKVFLMFIFHASDRFWSKFENDQKWYLIKELDEHLQKMPEFFLWLYFIKYLGRFKFFMVASKSFRSTTKVYIKLPFRWPQKTVVATSKWSNLVLCKCRLWTDFQNIQIRD